MGRRKSDLEKALDYIFTTYDISRIVVGVIGWAAFLAIVGVIGVIVLLAVVLG